MVPPLPEELLALILEEIALPRYDTFGLKERRDGLRSSMAALRNACLVSKTMYRLARPILYGYFSNRRRSWGNARGLDPARFLQTICTKPEYGLALRSLQIAEWASVDAMDPIDIFKNLQSDATLVDLFQWRARSFWLGEDQTSSMPAGELRTIGSLTSELLRSLEMGLPEAHMAMLLLLSPKLQTLDIRTPAHFETSLIARLLDNAFSKDYQSMTPSVSIHDPEQEESDYAVAQMFGASWPAPALQKPGMFQDLVRCAISGAGRYPSGLKFFKNLISLPAIQEVKLYNLEGGYDRATSDLEISAPCTRLRKLTLPFCRLPTNEAVSVIQCCPGLVMLDISWWLSIDQLSERDPRLKFGVVADAIATHTPALTDLRLTTSTRKQCHLPSGYPYTVGRSLQQLKYLEDLKLDIDMIYGMQQLEDLSFDIHRGQSSVNPCALGQILPNAIRSLIIEIGAFIHTPDGDKEPGHEWRGSQLEDLQRFLQDRSFERMCQVTFAHCSDKDKDYLDLGVVAKYGWEVDVGYIGLCRLVSGGRFGNAGR